MKQGGFEDKAYVLLFCRTAGGVLAQSVGAGEGRFTFPNRPGKYKVKLSDDD